MENKVVELVVPMKAGAPVNRFVRPHPLPDIINPIKAPNRHTRINVLDNRLLVMKFHKTVERAVVVTRVFTVVAESDGFVVDFVELGEDPDGFFPVGATFGCGDLGETRVREDAAFDKVHNLRERSGVSFFDVCRVGQSINPRRSRFQELPGPGTGRAHSGRGSPSV